VNGSSFLGDPSVPFPDGKDGSPYHRSRFMADELRFWLKRLVERAGHDICQGIGLASVSGIQECPMLFP